MGLVGVAVLTLFLVFSGGEKNSVPTYSYEIVRKIPHDPKAFTQGFLFHDGTFFESTGQKGHSSVRRIDPTSGTIEAQVDLDNQYFGEGLAFFKGVLVQLTWTAKKAFVYNHETLEKISEHSYDSQGWGLTHNGEHYIMSDGTHRIFFRDMGFNTKRMIEVRENGKLVKDINELEYINGEIWANVWRTWHIVRISPETGEVLGKINLKGIISREDRNGGEDYLNGIAYDKDNDAIYVTGKYYSYIYQINVIPAS